MKLKGWRERLEIVLDVRVSQRTEQQGKGMGKGKVKGQGQDEDEDEDEGSRASCRVRP